MSRLINVPVIHGKVSSANCTRSPMHSSDSPRRIQNDDSVRHLPKMPSRTSHFFIMTPRLLNERIVLLHIRNLHSTNTTSSIGRTVPWYTHDQNVSAHFTVIRGSNSSPILGESKVPNYGGLCCSVHSIAAICLPIGKLLR